MKQIILIFLLSAGALSAQTVQVGAAAQPQPSVQPKQGQATFQPRDFNYSFYPTDKYQRFGKFNVVDTTTNTVRIMQDSSSKTVQVVVEKQGDQFTIRGVSDPTAVFYRESVKFVGTTSDANQALIYRANSKDQETLFVNPITGFVVIGFNICDPEKKRCNLNFHYFGQATARQYMDQN